MAVKAHGQKKDFVFSEILISRMMRDIPPRHEGRIAVVTKRGAECGGREGAVRRGAHLRTAKSRGPDAGVKSSASTKGVL
jgi:hypothetical protein